MEEDKILYKEFLEGNKKSFEKILEKYQNNLIYFILKFVKNRDVAEDIWQDVILYILENKEKYNFNFSFKTYMYIIAKSKSLDYIKKQKTIENIDSNIDLIENQILEEIIINNEIKEQIQKVMNKMQAEYQLVIYLTQIEKLSYEEVSKIMGKNISQIKNLVHRAKLKSRKLLVENKIIEMTKSKGIRILLLFITIGILLSVATIAINNVVKYTKDGKPYVFYYEEVPEELKGQPISICVPANPKPEPPYRDLKKILVKYRDSDELDKIFEEAKDSEDEFKLTESGGRKLFTIIAEIFYENEISEEEIRKVRYYIENLNYKYVYSSGIDEKIINIVLGKEDTGEIKEVPEEVIKKANEINERIQREEEVINIIKKYYGEAEFEELSERANSSTNDLPYITEILKFVFSIIDGNEATTEEKSRLTEYVKEKKESLIECLEDLELKNRVENL